MVGVQNFSVGPDVQVRSQKVTNYIQHRYWSSPAANSLKMKYDKRDKSIAPSDIITTFHRNERLKRFGFCNGSYLADTFSVVIRLKNHKAMLKKISLYLRLRICINSFERLPLL